MLSGCMVAIYESIAVDYFVKSLSSLVVGETWFAVNAGELLRFVEPGVLVE